MSFEFAGAFSDVIFAIVERDDARDGGNIAIFREVLCGLDTQAMCLEPLANLL